MDKFPQFDKNIILKDLKDYVEENILPEYSKNDSGHDIRHIRYVIERSLKFATQFPNIDLNMVYVIAAFHDIAHHVDKDNHEVLSAKVFYEDEYMKEMFTDEQRTIIKEAIEDHRASLSKEPRSIYGKIVSSADRSVDLDSSLRRTHAYTIKHYPNLNMEQMIDRAYNHILKKSGKDGYARTYCIDEEYENYRKEVQKLLESKYLFAKRYMKVNNIYDIKTLAKLFAIEAYNGKYRTIKRSSLEKEIKEYYSDRIKVLEIKDPPLVLHPMGVGKILEELGYDDDLVASGYLHDVIKYTDYTYEDLKREFNSDICVLIASTYFTELYEKKEYGIAYRYRNIMKMPLRNKILVCADMIDELESVATKSSKFTPYIPEYSELDSYLFKKDVFKESYKALMGASDYCDYFSYLFRECDKLDEQSPIMKRLKEAINRNYDIYEVYDLIKNIFVKEKDKYYFYNLCDLEMQKWELKKIRDLISSSKPYVIEFTGTPRTGKTTTLNNLYDFFKKGGFNVGILEEFTSSKNYKENLKEKLSKLPIDERNIEIMKIVYDQLITAIDSKKDIILVDRSINDRQIWNYRLYKKGGMDEETYQSVRDKYAKLSKDLIDFLIMTYANPIEALRRDYLNSLSLEKRRFLNMDNLNEFNDSLLALLDLSKESVDSSIFIDTTKMSQNDVSLIAANSILPDIRKKYVKTLKKQYSIDD